MQLNFSFEAGLKYIIDSTLGARIIIRLRLTSRPFFVGIRRYTWLEDTEWHVQSMAMGVDLKSNAIENSNALRSSKLAIQLIGSFPTAPRLAYLHETNLCCTPSNS